MKRLLFALNSHTNLKGLCVCVVRVNLAVVSVCEQNHGENTHLSVLQSNSLTLNRFRIDRQEMNHTCSVCWIVGQSYRNTVFWTNTVRRYTTCVSSEMITITAVVMVVVMKFLLHTHTFSDAEVNSSCVYASCRMGVTTEKKDRCGTVCLKYLLFMFNFLFWVSSWGLFLQYMYI